jgi:predicted AlkP superfamily pyrophosphatase or phosphodiesterase
VFRTILILTGIVASAAATEPLVILVSIDGCRWDYPELHQASTLQEISAAGLHVGQLIPCYPTKTFPNHYTLVTGLRPETHGIIQNRFWDDDFQSWFGIGAHAAAREGRWWQGEPIWITAKNHGLRSATMFWPGSEADIKGQRPDYWRRYDDSISEMDRVKQVLEWTALPEGEQPNFIALYFEAVDTAGHGFGPEALETKEALHVVDAALTALRAGLIAQGLWETTQLIITSDHGMTPTRANRVIFLDDLIELEETQIIFTGTIGGLDVINGGGQSELLRRLNTHPHLQAFARADVPERLHFSTNSRIPDFILIPDLGWKVEALESFDPEKAGGGDHGYDNEEPDMASIFIAHGPAFKPRSRLDRADNIDVYNLLCALLEITPAPNEGSAKLLSVTIPEESASTSKDASRVVPTAEVSGR